MFQCNVMSLVCTNVFAHTHTVNEDSKSSDDEFSVSDEDDDGLVAVDHYESLVNICLCLFSLSL